VNAMRAMCKTGPLLLGLVLTTGCELLWRVPPANGRVVDIRSQQPIASAVVTRVCAEAPAKTATDAEGQFRFRGKRALQFFYFGDTLTTPASYRVEAIGYQSFQTNGVRYWANHSRMFPHSLGEIHLKPK